MQSAAIAPPRVKKAKHTLPMHTSLRPSTTTRRHNASPLEDNMGDADPVVLTSPHDASTDAVV